ncbi:hypothetical protein FSW04_10535 [Baekduia soli]|uniref:Uncharacterized protein n=1 Tax=Baekduia soli TaxID=496014 RepID=A0A5B8U5N4_9ACTN|nr:hypothetical protein [Baekduia soli]QEC47962.1 hypothetical protein FSW04_10535 [Baekduia soli]
MSARSAHRLISASDLKRQRGWTETLVDALLGAPDALCPNPHGFRSPMRWFRADRVLDAEAGEAFRRRLDRLGPHHAWRRGLPTRTWSPDELEHLEWLEDPARIALFHAPRRPRMRRPRRAAAVAPVVPTAGAVPRFEVLRLF